MRAYLLVLALLVLGTASAHTDDAITRSYVGATVRDPLFGPIVVCDPQGNGIGGACFDAPYPWGWVSIIVHDENAPDWAHVPIMIYGYGNDIVPEPIDGEVECPVNHGAVKFWFQPTTTRIVVATGPWVGPGITCAGVPGSQGTIELVPWLAFPPS